MKFNFETYDGSDAIGFHATGHKALYEKGGVMSDVTRVFQWYLKTIWPLQRRFVKSARRCERCILSEHYCKIEGGLCEICRNPRESSKPAPHFSHQDLADVLIPYQKTPSKYHASLLLSGGKDSTYLLHRLRREFPDFRMLALTINNGFMSPRSLVNAQRVAERCQVDHVIVNSYIPQFRNTFRKAFLELKGQETYGVIDKADGDLIYQSAEDVSQVMGISLLIGGLSWVQVDKILGQKSFVSERHGVTYIHPLVVWKMDEQEIRNIVREEGYLLKGSDDPVVSNNRLIPCMAVLDMLNLGYSSFEPEFAQLVREGKSDRQFWVSVHELLEYAVRKRWLHRDANRVLSELGLNLEQLL